jgi:hypothetical protein
VGGSYVLCAMRWGWPIITGYEPIAEKIAVDQIFLSILHILLKLLPDSGFRDSSKISTDFPQCLIDKSHPNSQLSNSLYSLLHRLSTGFFYADDLLLL